MKPKKFSYRICKGCSWVYFSVSREYAIKEVATFNKYFDTLSKKDQNSYYGGKKANIKFYEKCWCGNSYMNFRRALKKELPIGSTLGPIIWEKK